MWTESYEDAKKSYQRNKQFVDGYVQATLAAKELGNEAEAKFILIEGLKYIDSSRLISILRTTKWRIN